MTYYLVATEEQELSYWKIVDNIQTWVTELVPAGTVINAIVYDGTSPYTPPEGAELTSSENVFNIGDMFIN